MKSKFRDNDDKSRGYSFSVGREKLSFGKVKSPTNPGPGTYYEEDADKHYKSLYSLRKKINYADWLKPK